MHPDLPRLVLALVVVLSAFALLAFVWAHPRDPGPVAPALVALVAAVVGWWFARDAPPGRLS